ncbi:MAG TPA: LLM class F420-dependent oxidoreductase [Pseudomonadales bacterium]
MHIGALIFATDYAVRVDELAVELERRGYESLFVPEHTHIPTSRESPWPGGDDLPREYWHTYDPFVSLSFAAAATGRLKIGTGICLLPQRDTLVTAKLVASLDRLSGGRFLFGIGGGWNREEMAHHGTDYHTRFQRMEEQVQAMKRLWTEDAAAFDGRFVRFSESLCYPKPVQTPHPPILLGGESDHTLRRIVRFCDGWLPRARGAFDAERNVRRLERIAAEHGRPMDTLSVSVFGARSDADTLQTYRDAGITRAILPLPAAPRDEVWRVLDRYQPLL